MAKGKLYGAPWTPKILDEAKRKETKSLLTGRYPFSEMGSYIRHKKEIQEPESIAVKIHGSDFHVYCKVLDQTAKQEEVRNIVYHGGLATTDDKKVICSMQCYHQCFIG